jgi:hypothetical protein
MLGNMMATDPADIVREINRLRNAGISLKEIMSAVRQTFPTSTTTERLLAVAIWMGKDSPEFRASVPELVRLIDAGPLADEVLAKAMVRHLFPDMSEEQALMNLKETSAMRRKAAH